jgi:5-methylcytosine-specific restriction enzyme A
VLPLVTLAAGPARTLKTRLCSQPACTEVGVDVPGGWLCETHRKERRAPRRTTIDPAYSSSEWKRTRAAYRQAHPTCQALGCPEPVAVVHHIDGLGPSGPRGYDWTNLASLCVRHHRLITCHPERVELDKRAGWVA